MSLTLAFASSHAAAEGNIKWGAKFFPLNKQESSKIAPAKNAGAITSRKGAFFALATTRVNNRTNLPKPKQSVALPKATAKLVAPSPKQKHSAPQPLELASLPEPEEKVENDHTHEIDIDEELPAEIAGSDEYQKAIKSILPTLAHAWPFEKGDAERITSAFGWRKHPVIHTRAFHQGIDIAAAVGTEVLASADGVVAKTGEHKNLGRFVKILHGDGSYSVYGHLKNWAVKTGELVKQGTKIAEVGMTGRTTGPHLHYSIVVEGKAANPMKFLKKNLPDSQLALVM